MSLRSAPSLLLLLLLAACAPELRSAPTSRMGAPLALTWTQEGTEAQGLRLVARLEARAPLPAPVQLRLHLPAGVRLLEGPDASTRVQAQGSAQELRYLLALDAVPRADLVLEARVEAPGFGARARAHYAFGREAALQLRARPAGPPLPQSVMLGTP